MNVNGIQGTIIVGLLSLLTWTATAEQKDSLHPFPKADEGFKRTVIRLPKLNHEDKCKVEIMIGKTMKVDCNHTWFGGSLEAKDVQGWGYTYWVLPKASGPASTLMGCPDNSSHDQFVCVQGDGYLLRYNSRLPMVIYVPKDFEVRYRLWQAQEKTSDAKEE
jgi:ecotin